MNKINYLYNNYIGDLMKKILYKKTRMNKKTFTSGLITFIIIFIILKEDFLPYLFFIVIILGCFYFNYKPKKNIIILDLNRIDKMSGEEFEDFLAKIYRKKGYKVIQTPHSSDYGADLIITKSGYASCIQAKRYSSNVGSKAIQEVQASLNYYKASKGIVITNSKFTPNAIKLAKANHIQLIDRNALISLMNSVK